MPLELSDPLKTQAMKSLLLLCIINLNFESSPIYYILP